jgi:hypothetical protein
VKYPSHYTDDDITFIKRFVVLLAFDEDQKVQTIADRTKLKGNSWFYNLSSVLVCCPNL